MYVELLNFELEVTNILETRAYKISDKEEVPIIKHWLGQEGLLLIKTFTQKEKMWNHKGTMLSSKR